MKGAKISGIAAFVSVVSLGCAGIDVESISRKDDGVWSSKTAGFRYYMPEPYLLVTKAAVSPVRIEFVKDKVIMVPSGGAETPIELGKLVGLDPNQSIKVTISDNTYIKFKTPDAQPPDGKQTTVKASSNGIVQVSVVFATIHPGTDAGKFTMSAAVDSLSLGSGTYEIKASAPHNTVKSLGGGATASGYTATTVYLPNPDRIVAVEPIQGIGGSAELSFKLKDGWMLTEVGTKSDTQADETINSIANVIKEVGGLAAGIAALSTADGKTGAPGGAEAEDPTGLYRPVYENGIIVRFQRVNLILR